MKTDEELEKPKQEGTFENEDKLDRDFPITVRAQQTADEFNRLNARIASLEAELNQKWISVKDRLPEGGDEFCSETVLIYSKDHNACFTSFYWKKAKHWRALETPTHWQPLPSPPKE